MRVGSTLSMTPAFLELCRRRLHNCFRLDTSDTVLKKFA